ncbi:MAG: 50S ribosomal protein L19 [Bdellovibrionales bacterium]|nr:50S ribosomal protein L19 [Bdellovibrionales bacterium]
MNAKDIIDSLQEKKHPHFQPGDTVRVHIKITEGDKERVQVFQGIVIAKKGGGNSASFTVRKMSFGVGVERIFPMQCASIEKVEMVQQGKVRRSKLFYIRSLKGKSLRIAQDEKERNEGGVTETTLINQDEPESQETQSEETSSKKASSSESQTEANA